MLYKNSRRSPFLIHDHGNGRDHQSTGSAHCQKMSQLMIQTISNLLMMTMIPPIQIHPYPWISYSFSLPYTSSKIVDHLSHCISHIFFFRTRQNSLLGLWRSWSSFGTVWSQLSLECCSRLICCSSLRGDCPTQLQSQCDPQWFPQAIDNIEYWEVFDIEGGNVTKFSYLSILSLDHGLAQQLCMAVPMHVLVMLFIWITHQGCAFVSFHFLTQHELPICI